LAANATNIRLAVNAFRIELTDILNFIQCLLMCV